MFPLKSRVCGVESVTRSRRTVVVTWVLLALLFCGRRTQGGEHGLMVFPRDQTFQVGSSATFYCVLPPGQMFDQMYVNGQNSTTNVDAVRINESTFALTVHLERPSDISSTDIICKSRNQEVQMQGGASAFVGYPPDDKTLQCETRDLESVECHWKVGRSTHLSREPTTYRLLGGSCTAAVSVSASRGQCSQKVHVKVVAGVRNWTLTAENVLGKVELTETADLTHRVRMFAPEDVTASAVTRRKVTLKWRWTVQRYRKLNVTCRVKVSHDGTSVVSEASGVGLNSAVVTELIPNWKYNVTVQCRTTQHSWKWGDWSSASAFHTEADVPDALDVWMQMKQNHIVVIWKELLDHQSHGRIIDYTVTWTETTATEQQRNTTTVIHSKRSVVLSVDTSSIRYRITVTARNDMGNSPPSTITTPNVNTDLASVHTSRITGVNGSFPLSWSSSPAASCGYIVDWRPTSRNDTVEWLKVSRHETSANILSKSFKDGLRYSLSIFACTHGAPELLERREGYVREQVIPSGLFTALGWRQQGSKVDVTWAPVAVSEQTAFIEGYVLYWSNSNRSSNVVFNVSTDNPDATSLTATDLEITTYTFTVKALTAVGECGTTSFTVTLNSPTDNLIRTVVISLVSVFLLLLLITLLCCRQWECIKSKIYPPIPEPMLTDKWMLSQVENLCHPRYVDRSLQGEVMDVPELLCETRPPVTDHVTDDEKLFVFTQTPKGYYNQPLKIHSTSPSAVPTESDLPSSLFRGVFANPSYNPTLAPDNEFNPELHNLTSLQNNCDGYTPQSRSVTVTPTDEDTDSHCVVTYLLLPQTPPI
ncbi:hypothetical protein JOB18_021696 [Solea senegalensis]|uniref:Leukemia inhibitory factor receptor-like n=1 Tax=Solea senegalensis TaxID=28829 RepID=A0AAV6QZW8_SOLSE|nr:leukemia inhibitory factor receptor-like [Solea senegalensis]XP_043909518.1 leukemia inhibitory factor receptor-like [Solea senegalensis]KAG7498824.1 leukemia inhibitory factor receptor-like [Solea senegalensis]KAG7498825.1 hypothetical protein JOB18_021696 [Solea senegalensis]